MINKTPIDRFTVAHFIAGFLAQKRGLSMTATAALAIGWELLEQPLKRNSPHLFPNPSQDSSSNALLDVGASLAGFIISERL